MSACGKKTSGPLGLGVSTCVRASWHDGECRPWLTSDERDEAELATLRADLARATAERDAYKRAKEENDDRFMRERDDARAAKVEAPADVAAKREMLPCLKPVREWRASQPDKATPCKLPRGHEGRCDATGERQAFAPKPEPAGLEPLKYKPGNGFTGDVWEAVISRVNELSAIAKRGGL